MARIGLTAKSEAERRVLAWLESNASAALAAKIAGSGKGLGDALRYCEGEARKAATGGVACVPDETVFGWVVHYFEDVCTVKAAAPAESAQDPEPAEAGTEGGEAFGGVKLF